MNNEENEKLIETHIKIRKCERERNEKKKMQYYKTFLTFLLWRMMISLERRISNGGGCKTKRQNNGKRLLQNDDKCRNV